MLSRRELIDEGDPWRDRHGGSAGNLLRRETRPGQRNAGTNPAELLRRAIELDVLPRLVLSHRINNGTREPRRAPAKSFGYIEVAEYARLLLDRDAEAASTYLSVIEAGGMTAENIYLDLLAPAARRLGDLWSEDLCDFTQVTIGVMRLQQAMREISPAFLGDLISHDASLRILLLPAPGEQHSFGLSMVSEFFRRDGWAVWGGPRSGPHDAVDMVSRQGFAIVGFSVGSVATLDRLHETIRTLRRRSRVASIGVLVGGPVFLSDPALAGAVGADATAADGREAVQRARGLLASRAARIMKSGRR